MPICFFAHSILKQSREYFVYLCLKYQCCMNHSPVLCFLSLFPAGNLLSSYSANYTGKFTTTIHLDQSGDRLSPIYFKTKTTLYKRLFFFQWNAFSCFQHIIFRVEAWHLFMNTEYHCWPKNADASNPTPFNPCKGQNCHLKISVRYFLLSTRFKLIFECF